MDIPELDKSGLRKFGLLTGAIIVGLFGFILPWLFNADSLPKWPWIASAMLWAPAIIWPTSLHHVYIGWMKVGHVLGWINTRIILGLVFYIMVLPMGLAMRLFGGDPMGKRVDTESLSFREKTIVVPKARLEKPY